MKVKITLSFLILLISPALCWLVAHGQQSTSAPGNPPPKPTPGSPKKTDSSAQSTPQTTKPEPGAADLIAQGKSLYRLARFKQALVKFEAALKQEPKHDEGLGLAAVTAFRLDNQAQAREYFLRRAELSDQKDSVKAYCSYRVALTFWRDAHDIVAKYGNVEDGKLVQKMPERPAADVAHSIANGLEYVDRALSITNNISDAYNVKNLLHAEAALAEKDKEKANEQRKLSIDALRQAIELDEASAGAKRDEAADFSLPTIRIAEFAKTKEEEDRLEDPMMKLIEGGRPIKRVKAVFPRLRSKPADDSKDDSVYLPGTVKVEVLISTTGDVVFVHVVNGRSDLNNAAIIAARNWKFEPARFEGRPVQVSGVITFDLKP